MRMIKDAKIFSFFFRLHLQTKHRFRFLVTHNSIKKWGFSSSRALIMLFY